MRIQVLSDLHLESAPIEAFDVLGDILVLAGDIACTPQDVAAFIETIDSSVPIVYILGNHEFDHSSGFIKVFPQYRRELARFPNLHLLEEESVVFNGVRFLGATLWTDMGLPAHYPLFEQETASLGMGVSVDELLAVHTQSVEWLRAQFPSPEPTVVVTHMAPSARSSLPKWKNSPTSGFFWTALDELVVQTAPKFWIHGHLHNSADYLLGTTRVVSHPRGYPGENPGFAPDRCIIDLR
ncbi:MAG TPA: metallophosphoesterase [Candidatus Baltobacteraceae bacterium]|jgi:Icc-related predicted phosphoesterase|nr:metallophosphoesterase [Candidatus Baltobacteraceae bacterium]